MNNEHQDAVWYQNDINPINSVVHKGHSAGVYVVGDVRILIEDAVYRNVDDLIDRGISDDFSLAEAEASGTVEFHNNNWFEIIEEAGAVALITGIICHTYDEAADAALQYLKDTYGE